MRWKSVLVLGFFDWLLPFGTAMLIFPLSKYDLWLYSNFLNLFHLPVVIFLLNIYAKGRALPLREAVTVTSIWVAMNIIIDQPIFVHGPLGYTFKDYMYRIGFTYLNEVLFAAGAAWLYVNRASKNEP